MRNVHLLAIDFQNDFCDPKGSLYVGGGDKDATRIADMIFRIGDKISFIHATMDTHRLIHIAHPLFWTNENGKHPDPFTVISEEDVAGGKWGPTEHSWYYIAKYYVTQLKRNGRHELRIWPPHCLIGTWGHNIYPPLMDAITMWEQKLRIANFIVKGTNLLTEHYSALKAEVPSPEDPDTQLKTNFIEYLKGADDILVAGEALSHCVRSTVKDIVDNIGEDNVSKLVLLSDASSCVSGCEQLAHDFVQEMVDRGVRLCNSTDWCC